jgi:hypothetical protein
MPTIISYHIIALNILGYQRPELIIETNIAELFVGLTPFAFRMWPIHNHRHVMPGALRFCRRKWKIMRPSCGLEDRFCRPEVPGSGQKTANTLCLCQNSYWKWPCIDTVFIVDLPIENGDFPVRYFSRPEGKPAIPGKSNGETDHFICQMLIVFDFVIFEHLSKLSMRRSDVMKIFLVSVCESTLFYYMFLRLLITFSSVPVNLPDAYDYVFSLHNIIWVSWNLLSAWFL